jgi:hypothetical protein
MISSNKGKFLLSSLSQGLPGVTPSYGQTLAEAGSVCFEDQGHQSGVSLLIEGDYHANYDIFWNNVTPQMLSCWNDEEYTTEQAAYGIAFLLILELTPNTIIKKSRKGTGFDYWLGNKGDTANLLFQNAARLEVSGIRNGDHGTIKSRIRQKLKQTVPTDKTKLPAYIIVVEFSAPVSQVVKK